MYQSQLIPPMRADQSYIRKEPLQIKQVKTQKLKLRNETVKNFTIAVLCGIALILTIKYLTDFRHWI